MGRIGMGELVVVLLVVLLVFGAKRLPEIGQAIGRAIKEFKKSTREFEDDANSITDDKDSGTKK